MKTAKKLTPAKSISNHQFQMTFVLGGNHEQALKKLEEIKDSMVEVLMIDKEVEIGLTNAASDIVQLVYLEADMLTRRFKKQYFEDLKN
jgi:hypothetical protein